jgi:hypothetical protein
VDGLDTVADTPRITGAVGYVSQAFSLYGDLTGAANLQFFGEVRGLLPVDIARRRKRLLGFTEPREARNKMIGHVPYSQCREAEDGDPEGRGAPLRLGANQRDLTGCAIGFSAMLALPPSRHLYSCLVTRSLCTFVVWLLLAWLPLQAAALPALALLCEDDLASMHGAVHSHHHHDDDSQHDHGDGGGTSPPPHTCCHHFFTAPLPAPLALSDAPAESLEPTALFQPHFFFPEPPKQPPLVSLV